MSSTIKISLTGGSPTEKLWMILWLEDFLVDVNDHFDFEDCLVLTVHVDNLGWRIGILVIVYCIHHRTCIWIKFESNDGNDVIV